MNYKIVTRTSDGSLKSFFVHNNPFLSHEYVPGEWTEARPDLYEKGYGLFFYNDLEEARREANHPENEVWECEVEDDAAPYRDLGWEWNAKNILQLLEAGPTRMWQDKRVRIAKRIKLTKQVA